MLLLVRAGNHVLTDHSCENRQQGPRAGDHEEDNANLSVGNASNTESIACASCSDSALLMTRKSVNILSGTDLKGATISSETSKCSGNASRCPMRLVVMMAMP